MSDLSFRPGKDAEPRTVLVVDDEQDIRDLVAMWLGDDPRCSVGAQAADLDSALHAVHAHRYDAVLLDFYLGARSSVEGLPEMRRALPDALIVVYTASREAAEQADVITAGADLILEKANVSIDDVVETVLTAVSVTIRTP